jgi:hypothetical protein
MIFPHERRRERIRLQAEVEALNKCMHVVHLRTSYVAVPGGKGPVPPRYHWSLANWNRIVYAMHPWELEN